MSLFHYCLAIILTWIVLFGVIDGKHKSSHKAKIECGAVFNQTSRTISNKTLAPGHSCTYFIMPAPKNVTHNIKLLLKKLILDENDNVTIMDNSTKEILFPVFHGSNDAIPLITNSTGIAIIIDVSSVEHIIRDFEAFYDSTSPDCVFQIDNDIPTIQEPYSVNNSIDCEFFYNVVPVTPTQRSFSFDVFNISKSSSVGFEDVQNPTTQFSGDVRPQEVFAVKTSTKITISINKGDHFIIRQHHLNPDCSRYVKISGSESLQSPKSPEINNGSFNLECRWLIEGKKGGAVGLTEKDINLTHPYDVVVISDGDVFDASVIYQFTSSNVADSADIVILSSESFMVVSFKYHSLSSSINITVGDAGNSKLAKNNGTLEVDKDAKMNTFLLEVADTQNVLLSFTQSIDDAILDIHDDFHYKGKNIATLTGDVWYPVLSSTNRMMVVATVGKTGFSMTFQGTTPGCMKMNQGTTDNSYVLSKNCESTCQWIIPPSNLTNTDLILDLQYLALEQHDNVLVKRLNKDKEQVATITSSITHAPKMKLNAKEGALVEIDRGQCNQSENIILVAQSTYLPDCSGSVNLSTAETVYLTSPGFPNTYPLLMDCKKDIYTKVPKPLVHVVVNKLQLAEDHCLTLKQGSNTPIIFTGSESPDDAFFTGNISLQFNSDGCGKPKKETLVSDQGFALNVTAVDCGGIVSNATGNITSVANKTLCIWKLSVPPSKGLGNMIIFSVKEKTKIGNFDLDVYDGASTRYNKITNLTAARIWSRNYTLIIMYKPQNISKPASEITISYETKSCNKTYQCDNGICLHQDWLCDGKNDCGDFTDEKDCASVPTTPPPPSPATSKSGVSPTTFAIVIIVMFALGAFVAVLVPNLVRKYRNGQYSQFRDVSVIE